MAIDNRSEENTMNMTIGQQKNIAEDIMDNIKIIDPYALLAGGAPRDWYFGNTCNDLDIYYYSNGDTVGACKGQLESLFPHLTFTNRSERFENKIAQQDHLEIYNSMKFLKRVFETTVGGLTVQFIQLEENKKQFKVVEAMDVSICQCWYNHYTGVITLSDNFKMTLATNIMFLPNGNSWSDKHPSKMHDRFPKLARGTYKQAKDNLIRKALGGY